MLSVLLLRFLPNSSCVFPLCLPLFLCLSFCSAASLVRKSSAKRNINQSSIGRTSEPASGNVRPIGLKAFSLHEILSNGLPRRPADATLNSPSRLPHTNFHKAFVGWTAAPSDFAWPHLSLQDRPKIRRLFRRVCLRIADVGNYATFAGRLRCVWKLWIRQIQLIELEVWLQSFFARVVAVRNVMKRTTNFCTDYCLSFCKIFCENLKKSLETIEEFRF